MACVVRIFWKPHARPNPRAIWNDVELDVANYGEALDAIASDALIAGNQLWSRAGDTKGERIVYRRRLIRFRGCALDRVELSGMQMFFEEGAE